MIDAINIVYFKLKKKLYVNYINYLITHKKIKIILLKYNEFGPFMIKINNTQKI